MSKLYEMANEPEKGMLVYIQTNCIDPHPDNPRKDLGELTELADSIKQNGILQNLTVVPWFDEITHEPSEDDSMEGHYRALIGHRRLAAAKLAGLEEVPCVIVEMSYRDQLQTMLQENMQRSDLTVYEQAQGFQMMLDLGETVETLAEKSGFSQSTIRRRVKLLDLDEGKFKASVERGATLADYAELDKLESTEAKNKVLTYIGTANFKNELNRALDKQKAEKRQAAWRAKLSTFATEVKSRDGYTSATWISTYSDPEEYAPPEDADKTEYFFIIDQWGSLYLLKKSNIDDSAEDEERTARAAAAARENARREELKEASDRAYNLRLEFVKGVCPNDVKEHLADVVAYWMFLCTTTYARLDEDDIISMFRLETYEDEDECDCVRFEDCHKAAARSPEWALWRMIWLSVDDAERYSNWWGRHEQNKTLDAIYALLTVLGYEMSDEERQLQDGTHPLFQKEE